MRTAEEFRQCALSKNIQFWLFGRCPVCGEAYGFYFFIYKEGEVVTDASCSCSDPQKSSWQDVVREYNKQDSNIKYKIDLFFGFDKIISFKSLKNWNYGKTGMDNTIQIVRNRPSICFCYGKQF